MAFLEDRVRLNVGGRIFETTTTTLANAGRNSIFGAMFDKNWNIQEPGSYKTNDKCLEEYFIDRNPEYFAILLDLLRTREIYLPSNISERLFYKEALYYGILDQVRSAKWGQLHDGNRLRFSRSTRSHIQTYGIGKPIIRASPDGGCCFARDRLVYVYDWMLNEPQFIDSGHRKISDVGWWDSKNIVISACKDLGSHGGIGLFDVQTGELRHRFQVEDDNQEQNFTAGPLSFDKSGHRIFSTCKGENIEKGIRVWDQITGKEADFLPEPDGRPISNAKKLQWLDQNNRLMVYHFLPGNFDQRNCCLYSFDIREPTLFKCNFYRFREEDVKNRVVRDAIAMENSNSICVVDDCQNLGFIDLRIIGNAGSSNGGGSSVWNTRWGIGNGTQPFFNPRPCYPKLAEHQGQIFSSMGDSVSVFSKASV